MSKNRIVRARRLVLTTAAVSVAALVAPALAQSTYTWNTVVTSNAFLNSANWTGGPADTFPGVDLNASSLADGNAGDIAVLGAGAFSGTSYGINFGAGANTGIGNNAGANGQLTLAAFVLSGNKTIQMGSSSSPGILRLNGATYNVGGVGGSQSNLILAVADSATSDLVVSNSFSGSTGSMGLQLGSTGLNRVYVGGTRSLALNLLISEAAAGSGIRKAGTGTLNFAGSIAAAATSAVSSTYSGGLALDQGVVRFSTVPSVYNVSGVPTGGVLGTGGLTINGGVIQGSGANPDLAPVAGTVVNADFGVNVFGSTLNGRFGLGGNIDLGGTTRTVTLGRTGAFSGSTVSTALGNTGFRVVHAAAGPSSTTLSNGTLRLVADPAMTTDFTIFGFQGTVGFNGVPVVIGNRVVTTINHTQVVGQIPNVTIESGGVLNLSDGANSRNLQFPAVSGAGTITSLGGTGVATLTYTGSSNTSTFTGNIMDGATAAVLLNNVSGATGRIGLTKAGGVAQGGLWVLAPASGSNSYSGPTLITHGTLRADDNAGLSINSNLNLNGGILETGANFTRSLGTAAGQVQLVSGNGNLPGFSAFGAAPVTIAIGGIATPTPLVWGTAPFAPPSGSATANQGLLLNDVTANQNLTFANPIDLGASTRHVYVNSGTVTMTGALTSSGGTLGKNGPGTLILSADASFPSGTVFVNNGNLVLGNGGTTGMVNTAIGVNSGVPGGTVVFNRSDDLTFASAINGAGLGLTKLQPNTLTFTGSSFSLAGTLRVLAGQINVGADNSTGGVQIGSGPVVIATDAAIVTRRSNSVSLPGPLSGAGTFRVQNTTSGVAVNVLGDNSAFNGVFDIVQGTLRTGNATASGNLGNAAVNVGSTGVLEIARSDDTTIPNTITGAGNLLKSQPSTATFTGTVALTGTATVTAGTLALDPAASFSATTITINPGARFQPSGSSYTIDSGKTVNLNGELTSANVVSNGQVNYSTSLDGTIPNNFSGTGAFNKTSSSTLTFSGNVSFPALFKVSTGQVNFAPGATLTGINFELNTGGALDLTNLPAATLTVPVGGTFLMNGILTGSVVNNGTITIGTATSRTYPQAISGTGSLIKSMGNSTSTLTGALTYTGDTSLLGPDAGSLIVTTPLRPVTGSLVVTGPGASFELHAAPSVSSPVVVGEFAAASVGSNGQTGVSAVRIPTATRIGVGAVEPTLLIVTGLTIESDGTGAYSGLVDLGSGDLLVKGGAASLATLEDYARAYITSAGTTGLGASGASPSIDPYTTLGVIANADSLGNALYATFNTIPVSANDALAKFTYVGDTNLDGILDATDFNAVINGLTNSLTGWANGDSNHDGIVNAADAAAFLDAYAYYLLSGTPLGGAGTSGAIPEPAGAALLLATTSLALTRRRRA
jgi:fibronectin-binding autotransporter adhesin